MAFQGEGWSLAAGLGEKERKGWSCSTETLSAPISFFFGSWRLVSNLSLFHIDAPTAWIQVGPPRGRTSLPSPGSAPTADAPTPAVPPTLMTLPRSSEGTHAACQLTLLSPRAVVSLKPKEATGNGQQAGGHLRRFSLWPKSLCTAGDWLEEGLVKTNVIPPLEELSLP